MEIKMEKKQADKTVQQKPEKRKLAREQDLKKDVITRLNRIQGQVGGVKKMIEDDRYSDDILVQLSAIDKSVKGLVNIILEDFVHNKVKPELKKDNDEPIKEMIEYFKWFQ